MAQQVWMQQQDRSGLEISPSFAVPADKTSVDIELVTDGFLNEAQDVRFQLKASFNDRVSYEPFGSTNFRGGVLPEHNGQPGKRALSIGLNPEQYPTHLQVELEIAGTVNCGMKVEFF